jgi:16S rRNA (cytidine1402-2'-O)-methyltransferase
VSRKTGSRPGADSSRGRLSVVATPLGNLGDITLRAVETLVSADLVACEDTRRTRKLLTHLGSAAPTLSCHKFNERARVHQVLARLGEGKMVALVSDAGTPGLSDPGARLIKAVADAGYVVEPIPGPSAPAAAVSVCGMEAPAYLFAGYPPSRKTARRKFFRSILAAEKGRALEDSKAIPWPVVFFEAPHRIHACLKDLVEQFGDRKVIVIREMTKLHEEMVRGSLAEAAREFSARPGKGEFTLVVEGGSGPAAVLGEDPVEIKAAYRSLLAEGVERRDAMKQLSRATGLPRRKIYELVAAGGDGEGLS